MSIPMQFPDTYESYKDIPEMVKNISIIVGNGFDLSLFSYLNRSQNTSFVRFYYFLRSNGIGDDNCLVRKMKERKDKGEENWSDFETAIEEVAASRWPSRNSLDRDRAQLREKFLEYLNFVVSPDVLIKLDRLAKSKLWAYRTYAQFTADLDSWQLKNFQFIKGLQHRNIFQYDIFNLNYTSILDTYLFLDDKQFKPFEYQTSDRNFEFRINPRDFPINGASADTGLIGYLLTNIHHPHGAQAIPRSLLFGTGSQSQRDDLSKAYWGQLDRRYEPILSQSDLFILFGCSIGESDNWWWNKIGMSLADGEKTSELIIYRWEKGSLDKDIKDIFIKNYVEPNLKCDSSEVVSRLYDVRDRIYVVNYESSFDHSAFGFIEEEYKPHNRRPL